MPKIIEDGTRVNDIADDVRRRTGLDERESIRPTNPNLTWHNWAEMTRNATFTSLSNAPMKTAALANG